ncbi:flagellin [Comamonas jiangduensis]|uniref:flagellin N-terminal helical domain-containing protein n=1 Tax=Comamonas jiangduensis TaxID=1194168 RepID=UPI003BF78746
MAAIINTNIQSMNAQRNLSKSQSTLSTSMQRLSSGLRINSAKDDAAGLAISERMTTQTRGLTVAARNANDGISMAQTAEGALGSLTSNLQRIRELAVQARNATNSAEDRAALNEEVQQLKEEINRVARDTSFNGTKLLDGSFTNMAFQVGANQGQTIDITSIVNANSNALGSWSSVNTPSTVLAPVPTGTTAGAPVPGSIAVGPLASAVDSAGTATATWNGITATDVTGADSTAREANAIAGLGAAISGSTTLPAGVTVAVDTAGAVTFSNTSATAATFNIGSPAVSVTVPAQTTPQGGDFVAASLTVNGATVSVPVASNATQRISQLAQSINSAVGADPAVLAKVVDGKLQVYSEKGEVTIAIGTPTDAAEFKAQTGLAAGTTGAAGFADTDITFTALIEGKAETGFDALSVLDEYTADNAILAMDGALAAVNSARATLGAVQSRFQTTIDNLNITNENLTASKSRIMDADFAAETAALSAAQVLQQAGTAMVAQANQVPQTVLQLLQG